MSIAIIYFAIVIAIIIGVTFAKEPMTDNMIASINSLITWPNLLIASGVIGICARLDKLIKQKKDEH